MVDVLALLSGGGVSVAVLLIVLLVVIAIAVGAVFIFKKAQRYKQFIVEIWQKDGWGQLCIKYDDAGIFVDSVTKNKRLFLKRHNVGLDPDNIPYLTTSKGKKKIYLLQTGLKNFKYIKPNISNDLITFTVGEENVNWAVNAYERQKKLFSQSFLAQYLPFMILAFVCIIILILFIQLFNKFPVMLDIAREMKEVAYALAQAKSGTTILPP